MAMIESNHESSLIHISSTSSYGKSWTCSITQRDATVDVGIQHSDYIQTFYTKAELFERFKNKIVSHRIEGFKSRNKIKPSSMK